MSRFEFLMVFVAIIMGIGVTTLLRGTVDLFRASTASRPGPVHLLWILNLFLMHVVVWVNRWRAAGQGSWSYREILIFLFVPIVLFASTEWLFPPAGRDVDLATYFYDSRKVFFVLQGLVAAGMSLGPALTYGASGSALIDYGPLIGVPWSAVLAVSENRRVHLVGALFPAIGFTLVALSLGSVSIR